MRLLGLLLAALLSPALCRAAEATAFVNVNILPLTSDTVLASKTLIVRDGAIVSIGPVDEVPVPADADVIDGTDRFLVPGLTEMHGHIAGDAASIERTLTLLLANGVTTVRGMLGQPSHLDLRRRLADGEMLGPQLVTAGPSFNGRSVASPEAGRQMVRDQHAAGYDFLKIHPGLTREEFAAIAGAARELKMPFAGHVPEDVGVVRALRAGIATIDHLDGYIASLMPANEDVSGGVGGFFGLFIAGIADAGRIDAIAAATAAAGTWNVPTESLFQNVVSPELAPEELAARPEMLYMPEATVRQWVATKRELMNDASYDAATALRAIALRQQVLRSLKAHGAGLLLGSDSPQVFNVPGFALHRELACMVDAGLSPFEALRAGTVDAADFLRRPASGTVEAGKTADLILLDANPLDDIANSRRIHGVMVRGRWLSRTDLDAMLAVYKR